MLSEEGNPHFKMLWIYLLFLVMDSRPTVAACNFPNELLGDWLTSNRGIVTFTENELRNFVPCGRNSVADCTSGNMPSTWSCEESVDNKYLLKAGPVTVAQGPEFLYMCFDLQRLNENKYVYYLGVKELDEFFEEYLLLGSTVARIENLCTLSAPHLSQRHHLLIRRGTVASAKSLCPNELLGNFNVDPQLCNAEIDSCNNHKQIVISKTTCDPKLFYTEGGTLSCMHSEAADGVTYVTLYNEDLTVTEDSTYKFICVAISRGEGDTVDMKQRPLDCYFKPTNKSITLLKNRCLAKPCPSDFRAVYKTTTSSCDYTIDACEAETQIKLSSTACSSLPFNTSKGRVTCVDSVKRKDTTYLTVYNHDANFDDNSAFQFTCLAYEVSDDVLTFTQTPGGCHFGQNVSFGNTSDETYFEFELVELCPAMPVGGSNRLPIIALVGGILGLLLLLCVICSVNRKALDKGEEFYMEGDW